MSVAVANTTANVSGQTIELAERDQTITGLKTFDRDPSAPFAVSASSAVVTNLDADKLDGLEGSAYATLTGTQTLTNKTLTSPIINTTLQSASMFSGFCQGRLTLTTAVPVTTADVTAAGTIYFTPYGGNLIALYDGSSKWIVYPFTELSLALTATSGKPYDVFVYDNAGTPTLETLVWTDDTNRATALTLQNGVLVKTGATTRRYVGSFYASGANTTEDSYAKRYVWNYYNRVMRGMRVTEATNTWNYTTATIRQANGSTANQLDFIIGVAEIEVRAQIMANVRSASAATVAVGIGADSTSTFTSGFVGGSLETASLNAEMPISGSLQAYPAVGRHFWSWNEYSSAVGTTNWFGDAGAPTTKQSGIFGSLMG